MKENARSSNWYRSIDRFWKYVDEFLIMNKEAE